VVKIYNDDGDERWRFIQLGSCLPKIGSSINFAIWLICFWKSLILKELMMMAMMIITIDCY